MIVRADAEHLPLSNSSVQLIVTSPPYNLGKDYGTRRDDDTYVKFLWWMGRCLDEMYRVLDDKGGRLCLNIPLDINLQFDGQGRKRSSKQSFYHDMMDIIDNNDWIYNTTIIWNEGNTSKLTAWGSWMSPSDPWVNTAVEMILVLSKGSRKRKLPYVYEHDITQREFLQWTKGLWTFPGENRTKQLGHPAPYPVELPYRCIRLYSMVGDAVLDPFCGSGSTGVAAKSIGREFIGVDISPEFCKRAAERIASEVWVRVLQ